MRKRVIALTFLCVSFLIGCTLDSSNVSKMNTVSPANVLVTEEKIVERDITEHAAKIEASKIIDGVVLADKETLSKEERIEKAEETRKRLVESHKTKTLIKAEKAVSENKKESKDPETIYVDDEDYYDSIIRSDDSEEHSEENEEEFETEEETQFDDIEDSDDTDTDSNKKDYSDVDFLNLDYDKQQRRANPDFYKTGEYFNQGVNSDGYQGTCGEAALATIMNALFDTTVYTENAVLQFTKGKAFCGANGAMTGVQIKNTAMEIGNVTGDMVESYTTEMAGIPEPDELGPMLTDKKKAIILLDSYLLWGADPNVVAASGDRYYTSNHWLVLKSATYDKNGHVSGFNVVDSSGFGASYLSVDQYVSYTYGPTGREGLTPVCVFVSRK